MRRSLILALGTIALLGGLNPKMTAQTSPPPWQGNQVGVSDEVLPPWTPITVSGNSIGVWGRTYQFGPLPLPASTIACDTELLAAPITLTGVVDGKPLAWAGGPGRVIDAKPNLVQMEASAESGPAKCSGRIQIEYDGMIRCDLQIIPTTGKAKIDKLALEVPLKAEHAALLHTWPGRWGSSGNSAALPKTGYHGAFKPFVWLGDNERGLCWFSESDRNFFTAKPEDVLEIIPENDRVILRVHLVTVAHEIDKPLDYTFGFQATPVKPARPDAWDYRIVHNGDYSLGAATLDKMAGLGVRTTCFHEHWTDIQNYTSTTHGAELDKLVNACHERKIQLLTYFGYEMSNIAPEWDRYHEECLVAPRAGGYKRKPEQTAYIVCYRSHWQDFMAEGIDRVLTQHHTDGVYLDGTSEPWGCSNQKHGCGYVRPDGSIGTTYSFFATRNMMKRIYTIVKKHNPDGQVNVHQSTCMTIPTLAFATSYWDGEQLQSLKRGASALEVLPLDAFRAEFMGHNWGVPAELLWYPSGPFTRTEAVSLGLLHDIPTRPSSMADMETSSRLWKAFDAFGRQEATWLPYWNSEKAVKCSSPSVQVSLYNRPGQGPIAVIVNVGGEKCEANVDLSRAELKLPADLIAHDILTDKPVPMDGTCLKVSLGPLEHAVVWVKGK